MNTALLRLFLFLLFPSFLGAQMSLETLEEEQTEVDYALAFELYIDSLESTLTYFADTTLSLGNGMADLTIPSGYRYLGPEDTRTVLVDMWGNPPELGEVNSLGMLFPVDAGPMDLGGYGVEIFFSEDGYISDRDAAETDYDDLLRGMQAEIQANNEQRRFAGYSDMTLVGWAAPPHYDAGNKRLHWAKELTFSDRPGERTLNYNVLFLGRYGYLTMNVIGVMDDLPAVNASLDEILSSVNFTEGHRYQDYQPGVDRVAAYGIGALIAGKVLAKTGFLAMIGVFLLKAWKIILIGGIAVGAGLKRLVKR